MRLLLTIAALIYLSACQPNTLGKYPHENYLGYNIDPSQDELDSMGVFSRYDENYKVQNVNDSFFRQNSHENAVRRGSQNHNIQPQGLNMRRYQEPQRQPAPQQMVTREEAPTYYGNYPYPYKTGHAQQNRRYQGIEAYKPRSRFSRAAARNPRDSFPEITRSARKAYPKPEKEESNIIKVSTRKRFGLLERDYFSPDYNDNLSVDNSLGYNYKLSPYRGNGNATVNDINNNRLNDMINSDSLEYRYKRGTLPRI